MRIGSAVAIGAIAAVIAGAPAAHAAAVPFDLHYQLDGQSFEAGADYGTDSEFVGFCGEDTCQGFQVVAGLSSVGGETGPFLATLRGYACVLDASPVCSSTGLPFTGLRITERIVDAPEGRADLVFFDVTLCAWQGGWTAEWCTGPRPVDELIETPRDSGNLAESIPATVGT